MKKTYFAPQAELICFAPVETIASKWELDKKSNSWTFFNHWGSLGTGKNNTTEQVSGIMNWYDDLNKKTINDLD